MYWRYRVTKAYIYIYINIYTMSGYTALGLRHSHKTLFYMNVMTLFERHHQMIQCKKDDWHRIQDWPSWQSDDPMKGSTTMVGLSRIHPPLSCPHFRLYDGDCDAETMTTVICTGIIQHCDNRQHEKRRPLTVQMSLALTAIVRLT